MSYFVYIIKSESNGGYYIGSSHDPQLRLKHHNDGWTRSTRNKSPWKIVYLERCENKTTALSREKQIKRMKSRKYIERLIHAGGRPDSDVFRNREVSLVLVNRNR